MCLRTIDHLILKLWIFNRQNASFKIKILKVQNFGNFELSPMVIHVLTFCNRSWGNRSESPSQFFPQGNFPGEKLTGWERMGQFNLGKKGLALPFHMEKTDCRKNLPLHRVLSRLASVLKTFFYNVSLSNTCSQSHSDGSVLRTLKQSHQS